MAVSESLVNDFFPRLQITMDKLMTHKGIVMVAISEFWIPVRDSRYLLCISTIIENNAPYKTTLQNTEYCTEQFTEYLTWSALIRVREISKSFSL